MTHHNPKEGPARLFLYFIWGFAGTMIAGVLGAGYVVFESSGDGAGAWFLIAMAGIAAVAANLKYGIGGETLWVVDRLSDDVRRWLTVVSGLAVLASFVAMLYFSWGVLWPPTAGSGIGRDQALIEYMGREMIYALLAVLVSMSAFQILNPVDHPPDAGGSGSDG